MRKKNFACASCMRRTPRGGCTIPESSPSSMRGKIPRTIDPYIVLEYVAGEALNRILAREKKLPAGPKAAACGRDRRCAGLRSRPRRGSSRHQARKHSCDRGRSRQDRRLRHCQAESGPLHCARTPAGHSSLHGAGTVERRSRGRPLRSVFTGCDSLRHGYGAFSVSGRQRDHGELQGGEPRADRRQRP
jgi:hypothetical protein